MAEPGQEVSGAAAPHCSWHPERTQGRCCCSVSTPALGRCKWGRVCRCAHPTAHGTPLHGWLQSPAAPEAGGLIAARALVKKP